MPINIDASAILAALAECEPAICDELFAVCRARAEAGGPQAREWDELRAITALYPSYDLEQDPDPLPGIQQLDSIADERLAEWALLADAVGNQDLVARCSDLYWIRRQHQKRTREDIERARTAVRSYTASASQLGLGEHQIPCFTRFQRALRLSRAIGDRTLRDAAKATIVGLLRTSAATDSGIGSLRVMTLLKSEDVDCAAECADWCDGAAESNAKLGEATSDYRAYDNAADYRKLGMFWLQKTGLDDSIPEEWLKIAGYYEAAARIFEAAAVGSATPFTSTAVHWAEQSVDALRAAKAPAADIDAAHRRLLALQKESTKDLRLIEKKIDVTAMTHEAIDAVEGKPFPAALVGLLTCVQAPSAEKIRAVVQRRPLMEQLVAAVRVNQDGKPVATRESSMETSNGLWDAMVHKAAEFHVVLVEGAIMPARSAFIAAYPLRLEDVIRMTDASPLVQRGRERTYARGLHAGFTGDWMTVAHFLPPQIEQTLRMMFEAHGVITSGLHRSRQHEHDLNRLLAMGEATTILGESLRLDLAASLANGFGANVRNHMAHGLYDDGHYQSTEVIYMWWQAMRLIVMPHFMLPQPPSDESPEPTAPQADGQSEAADAKG